MKKARELEVLERLRGADTHRFILTWKENRDIRFTVDYTTGNSEETMKCSCRSIIAKDFLANIFFTF